MSEARNLLPDWTGYGSFFISFMVKEIYDITRPVSEYRQTFGLDILQTWPMVKIVKHQIMMFRETFPNLHTMVESFVTETSSTLLEHSGED